MNAEQLQYIIENALENTKALIETHDNVHFNATIISQKFSSIGNKVKRQQLIYGIINHYIASGEIHAISMKTYSPEQWQDLQGS